MKKVFLYAYDRQNLGDDLFVHTITKRYPHVKFYMWTGRENRETYRCLPNLKVVDPESRFVHLLRKLRPSLVARYRAWLEQRCAAVVYIGGSIFIEYPNWETILSWWDYEADHRPFYALGANFGPWHTPAYRDALAEIFSRMRDVCFRDRYSHDLFRQVPTVRQAPDILFSCPMPQVSVKPGQVFFSVIDCAGRDGSHGLDSRDGEYVENMARLLRGYLDSGCSPVLASFCRQEGDENGIRKILAAAGCEDDPRVRVLAYDGTNADDMLSAIASSEYIIATRFHATILAMAAGRPVLPIVYSDKTRHVLEDLGFEGQVFDIRDPQPWDYARSRRNWDSPPAPLDAGIPVQAQKHFEKLDKVLK